MSNPLFGPKQPAKWKPVVSANALEAKAGENYEELISQLMVSLEEADKQLDTYLENEILANDWGPETTKNRVAKFLKFTINKQPPLEVRQAKDFIRHNGPSTKANLVRYIKWHNTEIQKLRNQMEEEQANKRPVSS